MQFQYHANLTLGALRRWLIAQCYDSLLVSGLWLAALLWLQVPWAPFWALLAGALQFIPHFGPLLALARAGHGHAVQRCAAGALALVSGSLRGDCHVDGFLLQPYLMHRQNRVPFWASLLTPLLLGIVFPFWGVLLAPPLLAVIYAYRGAPKAGNAITGAAVFQPARRYHSSPRRSSPRAVLKRGRVYSPLVTSVIDRARAGS